MIKTLSSKKARRLKLEGEILEDRLKQIFESIKVKYGISQDRQWYNVKIKELKKEKSISSILKNRFKNSLWVALSQVYPHIEWIPWKFADGVPKGYWNDPENSKKVFEWIAKELEIKETQDWDRVSPKLVQSLIPRGLLIRYSNSWRKALMVGSTHKNF